MKLKLKYLPIIAAFTAFAACDPMDDVYDELHLDDNTVINDNMVVTLENSDYETLKSTEGVPSYIYTSHYFADEAEAGQFIPAILNKVYPQISDGSNAAVTYDQVTFDFSGGNKVDSTQLYTVKKEDYLLTGENPNNANFNSAADLINFLKIKFDGGLDTSGNYYLKILTYDFYSGSARTITKPFYKEKGIWMDNTYLITQSDYESTGHNYHDYQASDLPNMPGYFNRFLSAQISLANAAVGDVMYVVYYYYASGSTTYQLMAMMYDGTKWNQVTATSTEAHTLNFAKNSGAWEPNLTSNYRLVGEDYLWILDNATVGSTAAKQNLREHPTNFGTNFWSYEEIATAIGQLLDHNFPGLEPGQKYNVTFDIFSGTTSTTSKIIEKQENGEWIEFKPMP